MHNTPEKNEAFRKAWEATNARWKAQQKAHEANPETYKTELKKVIEAQKANK